ncbi:MAG: hypothetical protein ABIP77_00440 [Candidatus Limnocylindrales bacterium]
MATLRLAGHGRLLDGRAIGWSVAEGTRGRRWRWTLMTGEGNLIHAGLVELDVGGRFARLELETLAGMLTLHPDRDGQAAHGNVVRHDRVDPIAIDWPAEASVGIAGDPFGSAVAGWRGVGWLVCDDLTLEHDPIAVPPLVRDRRGVPLLIDPLEWPLEA